MSVEKFGERKRGDSHSVKGRESWIVNLFLTRNIMEHNFHAAGLKKFIYTASRATYASGDESIKVKQPDGSTTIEYDDGDWVYHDNYFGGEPYGGREVVFYQGKAVWMMVYYGSVYIENGNAEIYGFLMEALRNTNPEVPYRGPELFERDNWKYENAIVGGAENFQGTEKIYCDGKRVYEARYIGGLVDQ